MWNNNDVIEKAFYKRVSVRTFTKQQIDQHTIKQIIDIGLQAPTAGGIKCVSIKQINVPEEKTLCYKASFYQNVVRQAPLLLAVAVNRKMLEQKYKEPYTSRFIFQNGAAATMNMIVCCQLFDIATCYIGGIRNEILKGNIFSTNDNEVVSLLVLGYEAK